MNSGGGEASGQRSAGNIRHRSVDAAEGLLCPCGGRDEKAGEKKTERSKGVDAKTPVHFFGLKRVFVRASASPGVGPG
jgi:hypothetical protein